MKEQNNYQEEIENNTSVAAGAVSSSERKRSNPYLVPGSIVLAGLIIAGAVIYSNGGSREPKPLTEAGLEIRSDEAVLGNPKAPVTIIEYGDYQCPFCGKMFAETEPVIKEKYVATGKAKLVFRSFQFLGPESVAAGQAAYCAQEQGKFWEYHDALYVEEYQDAQEHNGNLNRELFLKIAGELGMDGEKFAECIDGERYASKVQEERTNASKLGVVSTPTTFVNGLKIVGAQPADQFVAAIEEALKNK